MQQSPSVPRRALKAVLTLGAVAAASLASAGVASAAVIVVKADNNSGTDNLSAAIKTANTNTSSSNTIVMSPGTYQLAAANVPLTITKNLTISGDHSFQSINSTPGIEVQGANAQATNNNDWVINPGITVTLEGFNFDGAGSSGNSAILDNGNLTTWGMEFEGPPGFAINVGQNATTTLNESTVTGALSDAINDSGTLNLNNVTIAHSTGNGIDTQPGYTLNVKNTLLATQGGSECFGAGGVTNGGPSSISDDATCNVATNSDTAVNSFFAISPNTNGGPTTSVLVSSNSDSTGTGTNCPTTDQRFFPNPVVNGVTQCDIGALSLNASQQTTAPSCAVFSTATDHSSQTVHVQDTAQSSSFSPSGVGLQAGPGTDNPTNTLETAYPPTAAPVPGYTISNEQINNGSIAAFTPFTSPSAGALSLVASKTTAGTPTQWSFTALNWAGVSKNCF